jgi:triacylglycerol lipase
VTQAYDQYDHFLNHVPWSLQGAYDTLVLLSAKPEGLLARVEPFGFVARNQTTKNVFVTFRGTRSLEDWLSDFTFPQVAHPWGAVEEGFAYLYAQCSADVKNAVKQAAGGSTFVTGHSLGAGLAVLAAADLVQSRTVSKAPMYSFAGPRVGNPAFSDTFKAQISDAFRIVNTEDIVTTLPLATPSLFGAGVPHTPLGLVLMTARSLDYEHVGIPVCFTTHKGSIPNNHAMQVYIDAVKAS